MDLEDNDSGYSDYSPKSKKNKTISEFCLFFGIGGYLQLL